MTRALISAEDRARLAGISRRVQYGATLKELLWLVRVTERLLVERDELLEQKFPPPRDLQMRRVR